ncbi:hypothetical protein PFICI_05938 [Pestalotiopsis fici W106-1]|uniref:Uncharacterized protein n=1 Tax=Pestalotiopsis fici (strain W106-1 / CGMCC3.15140) TaxID=1229662 RepID=W3XF59_PESFW|nr:uncharacterized protein PFICI_05938 [Pestalotiopsis fici W106-1]ETS84062.1 hypothetical protein PFICI_05938 [Pestalotiopsis fici W106-1]
MLPTYAKIHTKGPGATTTQTYASIVRNKITKQEVAQKRLVLSKVRAVVKDEPREKHSEDPDEEDPDEEDPDEEDPDEEDPDEEYDEEEYDEEEYDEEEYDEEEYDEVEYDEEEYDEEEYDEEEYDEEEYDEEEYDEEEYNEEEHDQEGNWKHGRYPRAPMIDWAKTWVSKKELELFDDAAGYFFDYVEKNLPDGFEKFKCQVKYQFIHSKDTEIRSYGFGIVRLILDEFVKVVEDTAVSTSKEKLEKLCGLVKYLVLEAKFIKVKHVDRAVKDMYSAERIPIRDYEIEEKLTVFENWHSFTVLLRKERLMERGIPACHAEDLYSQNPPQDQNSPQDQAVFVALCNWYIFAGEIFRDRPEGEQEAIYSRIQCDTSNYAKEGPQELVTLGQEMLKCMENLQPTLRSASQEKEHSL